ncbi:calcium/sodium antiporter [Aquimarina sp. ERC-38]|uniref:calcium/sodium antiporter n=1 Tax=Aquimarina sp. ERC-38 TaxID=2949996 RepID=UPI0022466D2F|nr:calcium/sodium antiporter [Aquimarina sp. ERC-38]UZO82706.1 calcium/sodium antiporter [Aquimarina sp. ERC-38]
MNIGLVILGFFLLVLGGEYLVRASVALSFKLNLSKMVIGLTVVSFATSAPELLVSLQAALDGSADLSLSNVIGSNIANIGLVLGITAMISTLAIDRDFFRYNWPVMVGLSIILYIFLIINGVLDRWEGFILLLLLAVYLFFLIRRAKKEELPIDDEVDTTLQQVSNFKMYLWLLIGGVALYFGSEFLVQGAKEIALSLGVTEAVIGLTMVAVGTSVPELAASIIAALKKEKALSLGNLIGSNIFNIASVLGITAVIQPIRVADERLINVDIFWMLGFALCLLPLALLPQRMQIGKLKGLVIFVCYAGFVVMAFL